jgi:hypothetical protein
LAEVSKVRWIDHQLFSYSKLIKQARSSKRCDLIAARRKQECLLIMKLPSFLDFYLAQGDAPFGLGGNEAYDASSRFASVRFFLHLLRWIVA